MRTNPLRRSSDLRRASTTAFLVRILAAMAFLAVVVLPLLSLGWALDRLSRFATSAATGALGIGAALAGVDRDEDDRP